MLQKAVQTHIPHNSNGIVEFIVASWGDLFASEVSFGCLVSHLAKSNISRMENVEEEF